MLFLFFFLPLLSNIPNSFLTSKSRLSQSLSLSLKIQTSVQSYAAFTKKEKILARSIKIESWVTLNCSQGIWSSYFRNVVSSCDSLLTWEDGAPFLPQDLPVKLSKHCLVKLADNVIKFSVVPSLSFLPYYLQFFFAMLTPKGE